MRVLVIHGPNLNLLGTREPQVYGTKTLDDINGEISACAQTLSIDVEIKQLNSEGQIIEALHAARDHADAIIINPAAYSHYSHAIADAIAAIDLPAIEVHLSNIFAREPFRKTSVVAPVCAGSIAGFGAESYLLALRAAVAITAGPTNRSSYIPDEAAATDILLSR